MVRRRKWAVGQGRSRRKRRRNELGSEGKCIRGGRGTGGEMGSEEEEEKGRI